MRCTLAFVLLFTASAAPASANGAMRQSPLLMHKAGAACAGKHRGPQRGAGYRYRLGGCLPGER